MIYIYKITNHHQPQDSSRLEWSIINNLHWDYESAVIDFYDFLEQENKNFLNPKYRDSSIFSRKLIKIRIGELIETDQYITSELVDFKTWGNLINEKNRIDRENKLKTILR